MLHFRELSRTKKGHCMAITKRSTPISGKIREINYIPEGDEKARLNLGLSGGDTNCVNAPGLYFLVLGSRKPT